jgi:hypothetical protein
MNAGATSLTEARDCKFLVAHPGYGYSGPRKTKNAPAAIKAKPTT